MADENTSFLRFSLEESVWFHRGQEVGELFSISLEPNVSVYEVEQYVILRGTLDLVGEYHPTDDEQQAEQDESNELFHRFAAVIESEDGKLEFHHQFPVDITVPAQRVQAKDELTIGVHTFDYKMQERGCLQISADLLISGIYEELPEGRSPYYSELESREDVEQPEENQEVFEPSPFDMGDDNKQEVEDSELHVQYEHEEVEGDDEEPIEMPLSRSALMEEKTDAKKRRVDGEAETYEGLSMNQSFSSLLESPSESPNQFYVETHYSPSASELKIERNDASPFSHQPEHAADVPSFLSVIPEFQVSKQRDQQPSSVENQQAQEYDQSVEHDEESIEYAWESSSFSDQLSINKETISYENTAEMDEEETPVYQLFKTRKDRGAFSDKQKQNENQMSGQQTNHQAVDPVPELQASASLFDFFGKDEEEAHARMRVCIIQDGDTVDTLAERYGINPQQILRVNHLDSEDLSTGQVVYIPQTAASSQK